MVCFSTYVFSMSQEFVPTCPREQWPHAEQDINQVLYSAIDGGKFHNKDHGGAVPKKNALHVFMYSTDQYKKSAPDTVQ